MRITADIIDEEIMIDSSITDKDVEAEKITKLSNGVVNIPLTLRVQAEDKVRKVTLCRESNPGYSQAASFGQAKVMDFFSNIKPRPCPFIPFNNHPERRSNGPSLFQRRKHCRAVPTVSSSLQLADNVSNEVNEINSRFKNMKLNDTSKSTIKYCCEYSKMASSVRHQMEQHKANNSKTEDMIEPPPWMIAFLQKMKQEIKEEVLEELAGSFQAKASSSQNVSSNAADDDEQSKVLHRGVFCDNCDQMIKGIRYKCGNCPDYDLCQECESLPNVHIKNHIFLKLRYPVAIKLFHSRRGKSLIIPDSGNILPAEFKIKNYPHKKMLDATFVWDETVPDLSILSPSTQFVKTWRVMNSGGKVWNHATKLQFIQGSPGFIASSNQVDVPHLRPGQEGNVSVRLTAPASPGIYKSCWGFHHKNRSFGNQIWCEITVADPTQEEQGDSSIQALSMPPDEMEQDVASITQILTSVKEEHERGNTIPRKLAVNSHTATPNNTPFDLSPPKSPDHHAHNELKEVAESRESEKSNQNPDFYDDDEVSVVSLSSSDSDAEFVVIPMPRCFNLSNSFTSQHISQLSQYLPAETVATLKDLSVPEPKVTVPIATNPENFNSERVSRETGVPELATHGKETEQKIIISHNVAADGSSSSEVSVIESGTNSPTEEVGVSKIQISVQNCTEPSTQEVLTEKNSIPQEENGETKESSVVHQPSSITFPKFPVEGITSVYEPVTSNTEQKTVQVLPERFMTAPLNAAATIYRTARDVITSLQQPERSNLGSPLNPMDQLSEMGFCNRQQNEELLRKHKNDVAQVVAELVNMNDNDWYASRHIPPSPPDFFD